MFEALTKEKKRELDVSFESRRLLLEGAARIIGPVKTLLDVGCGDGYFDLKMAEVFKPQKIILTDIKNSLQVQLPPNAEFVRVDVCSRAFLNHFQNEVRLVISSQALHEANDIFRAVANLFAVLPIGGTTLIFDYSQEGLQGGYKQSRNAGFKALQHFTMDFANLVAHGLDTNRGVKEFWEERIFPEVPGRTQLRFLGELYMVVYEARQWGQVKDPPLERESRLFESGINN